MFHNQFFRLSSFVLLAVFLVDSVLAQRSTSRSTDPCTTKYGKTSISSVPTTTITTTYRTIHITTITTVYKTTTAAAVTVNAPTTIYSTTTVVVPSTTSSVETDSTVATDLETTTSVVTSTASTIAFVTSTVMTTIPGNFRRDLAGRARPFPTAVTCSEHDVLYTTITKTVTGKGTVTTTPTSTGFGTVTGSQSTVTSTSTVVISSTTVSTSTLSTVSTVITTQVVTTTSTSTSVIIATVTAAPPPVCATFFQFVSPDNKRDLGDFHSFNMNVTMLKSSMCNAHGYRAQEVVGEYGHDTIHLHINDTEADQCLYPITPVLIDEHGISIIARSKHYHFYYSNGKYYAQNDKGEIGQYAVTWHHLSGAIPF